MITQKTGSENAILNLDAIKNLKELCLPGTNDLVEELVILYRKTTPHKISTMRTAAKEGNLKVLIKEAHTLKSSSGDLGANKVFSICQKIEDLQALPQKKELSDLLDSLDDQFQAAIETLEKVVIQNG